MDYYDEMKRNMKEEINRRNSMDIKDMCAKEAKERADAFLKAKENENFKNIMYLITDAADSGKYKIYLDDECNITLTGVIKNKLEQLGYKVEITSIQDTYKDVIGWKVIISWGDEEDG